MVLQLVWDLLVKAHDQLKSSLYDKVGFISLEVSNSVYEIV